MTTITKITKVLTGLVAALAITAAPATAALVPNIVHDISIPAAAADPGLTANEAKYVADLATVGVHARSGADKDLATMGWGICSDLNAGTDVTTESATVYRNSNTARTSDAITMSQAMSAVGFAVIDLCPPSPTRFPNGYNH